MWLLDGRKNEGHLSCVQRLERRQGFRGVGKVGGWCSPVGLTDVTGAWVLVGEGRKGVLTLVLVVKEGVDEEEKEEERPLGR